VLYTVMTVDVRLVKVTVSDSDVEPDTLKYECWSQVIGSDDPPLYEVVDGFLFTDSGDMLDVLEGRADVNYV